MNKLFSAFVAALALSGLNPAVAQASGFSQAESRQRLELARSRMALHDRAMASGDPSRSPYHRFGGPVGQSGSRHGEEQWYRELIADR